MLAKQVEDLTLAGQGGVDLGAQGPGDVRVDRVVLGQAVVGSTAAHVPVRDVDRREVGRHRLARAPLPRRPVLAAVAIAQEAIGDHLVSRRHGDLEVIRRLVDRVVVDREPACRDLGLSGDGRPLGRVHEPGPDVEAGDRELGRDPLVANLGLEPLAIAKRALRLDHELLAVAAPVRAFAVDLDAVDGHPDEVEIEAAQALRRLGTDRRLAVEPIRVGVVVDVDVVPSDVVAAVPVGREVVVAGARGPGRALVRGARRGRRR